MTAYTSRLLSVFSPLAYFFIVYNYLSRSIILTEYFLKITYEHSTSSFWKNGYILLFLNKWITGGRAPIFPPVKNFKTFSKRSIFLIRLWLLNEIEHDLKNYQARSLCYRLAERKIPPFHSWKYSPIWPEVTIAREVLPLGPKPWGLIIPINLIYLNSKLRYTHCMYEFILFKKYRNYNMQ
jgi:hypothetical protein